MAAPNADHFAASCPFAPDDWTPRRLPAAGGVYLLADADDRPVLLAAAMNLRTVVDARLRSGEAEPRSRRARLHDVVRRVYWTPVFSRFEADLRHWRAARTLFPRGFRELLGFGPAYFLRADPTEHTPRFTAVTGLADGEDAAPGRHMDNDHGDTPRPDAGALRRNGAVRRIGPFATRGDAEDFVRMLEDVFDLCRYHDVLERAPHGQACAYFDMGRCPAPCNGTVPLEDYRRTFAAALAFASGAHEHALAQLESRMRQAAAERRFERAASLRETVHRARRALAHASNRLVRPLDDFRWLVLQPGAATRPRSAERLMVKPFLAVGRKLLDPPAVPLSQLAAAWPAWAALLAAEQPAAGDNPRDAGPPPPAMVGDEAVWLTCRYLFAGPSRGGLFLDARALPSADAALPLVREALLRPRRPAQGATVSGRTQDPAGSPIEPDRPG